MRRVTEHRKQLSNNNTVGCPPIPGDNPLAKASGLSYVQADNHGITILYHLISIDLAHHEIFVLKLVRVVLSKTTSSLPLETRALHEHLIYDKVRKNEQHSF